MDFITTYFKSNTNENDYEENNTFYPPADIETILGVENTLSVKFPKDYVDFLLSTNGYEGMLGESNVFFLCVEKIIEYTEDYGSEFFPWIIFVGTDGGNEMYVIDRRESELQFGILPYIGREEDFVPLGNTFETFVRHLYHNDYW
jgi:hypothetical protein